MSKKIADCAISESTSRGRKFSEKSHPYRSDFERDRDRVIHCEAFRRLEGKTQVFTPGLDDSYRNRLTHTIEVAQIGRTIARKLSLNESLTEAICLAHDIGHPPFGHIGEKALDELMADFGGFEHNRQTLRIVTLLEHPYPDFAGLNLMYETRLGLAKHKSPYDSPDSEGFKEKNCSLEGQISDVADRIAYNCHDLEDGMRAGIIRDEQLKKIEIFASAQKQINADKIEDETIARTRTAKAIIDRLVSNCIDMSREKISAANIKTSADVYEYTGNLIGISSQRESELVELEKFLMDNFYMHKSMAGTTEPKVKKWLTELFEKLCRKPDKMPNYFQKLIEKQQLQRTVCDYIAGMTDRFCLQVLDETG